MRTVGWLGLAVACGLACVSRGASAQTLSRRETEDQTRERAVLLAQVLPQAVRARSLGFMPPLLIAAGVTAGVSGYVGRAPGIVAGGAVCVLGGAGFYAMSEQRNYELMAASAQAGMGLFYLGLPLSSPHERWQIPIGAGYLATSALTFVSFAYSAHPGRTRLVADLERVRTPAARSKLSAADVRELERDLYDTELFVPRWMLGLPLMASSAIAAAPLFDADISGRDKPLFAAFAGLALLQGLTFSFAGETPAEAYRRSLEQGGLWVGWAPMPGGVSVVGSFE
jgi:hypothetical protein